MKLSNRINFILASLVLSLVLYRLGYEVSQSESVRLLSTYGVAFLMYAWLLYFASKHRSSLPWLVGLGIGIRGLLVFAFPQLSDDIYRFLWDGRLMHDGIHPLAHIPKDIIDNMSLGDWYSETYPFLNSQEYFTVYPPLSQLVFYISTPSESWSWASSAVLMKTILFFFEIGSCILMMRLLKSLGRPVYWVLFYFLNPLVIMEVVGQLHYEGMMVFFLAGSLLLLERRKYGLAGILFACSVSVKLLPLMFVPVIWNSLRQKKGSLPFLMTCVLCLVVLFVPFFYNLDISHFLDSLNLYFQKFEFNASIYYLLRQLGLLVTGYNQIYIIGPMLSLISLGGILWLSFRNYPSSLLAGEQSDQSASELNQLTIESASHSNLANTIQTMFYCFCIFLFLTTTVHPWYLIMLVFLGILARQWWPLVWSGVVVLSYTTYGHPDFEQNLGLIAFEYLIVLIAIALQFKLGKLES